MTQLYSSEDVVRWAKVDSDAIALHLDKLASVTSEQKVDFHLDMLAGAYMMHGMTCIARRMFDRAIDAFRSSILMRCKMYERYERGQGRALEAGHFQSLLVAFVTDDEALVSQLTAHYTVTDGTRGSMFLGNALKSLAQCDVESASRILSDARPRFDPQFGGYAECCEAIACKNEGDFVRALKLASESWARWAGSRVKGLPDSVCFLHGAGFVRLAEKIVGHKITVADEHIPPELLR